MKRKFVIEATLGFVNDGLHSIAEIELSPGGHKIEVMVRTDTQEAMTKEAQRILVDWLKRTMPRGWRPKVDVA